MRRAILGSMNALLWLAVILMLLWAVIRMAFAVTGIFLHLLWIAALIVFLIWIFKKLTSPRS